MRDNSLVLHSTFNPQPSTSESDMRVTFNTFPNSLVTQLGDLASRQIRLQNQAATGQRIELPRR
jgi:hypothetical protein